MCVSVGLVQAALGYCALKFAFSILNCDGYNGETFNIELFVFVFIALVWWYLKGCYIKLTHIAVCWQTLNIHETHTKRKAL